MLNSHVIITLNDNFSRGYGSDIGVNLTSSNTAVSPSELPGGVFYSVGEYTDHLSIRVEDLNSANIVGNDIDTMNRQRGELINSYWIKAWSHQRCKGRHTIVDMTL